MICEGENNPESASTGAPLREEGELPGGRAHLRGADKDIDGHEALGPGHPGQRRPEEEDEKEARGVEDPD